MGARRDNKPLKRTVGRPPLRRSLWGEHSLAPTSVASAPTSSRGRLILLSRLLENATASASASDMGSHRGSSTNSFCFLAEISAAGGIDCAAMAGEAWWGGSEPSNKPLKLTVGRLRRPPAA